MRWIRFLSPGVLAFILLGAGSEAGADSVCRALFRPTDNMIGYVLKAYFETHSSARLPDHRFSEYKNNRYNMAGHTYSPATLLSERVDTRYIKKGDRVQFSDGSMVTVGDFLGAGNSMQIFEVQGQPKWTITIPTPSAGADYSIVRHDYWVYSDSAKKASDAGYPIIETKVIEGIIFRERLTPFQSIEQFVREVSQIREESHLNALQRKKIAAAIALVEFFRGRTDILRDVRTDQIGWQNDRWVIFDFLNYENITLNTRGKHFLQYKNLNREILENLTHFPSVGPYFETHFGRRNHPGTD
jgi:hypothetical protein